MTKERISQYTLRISQANPTDLVVILYEMTLDYLDEADEALQGKKDEALAEAVRKIRGCLNELLGSLHMEYEICVNLRQLYLFCIRRLVHVQAGEEGVTDEIRKVITPLRDAYAEVAKANMAAPVMGNSQTVYAGLTYGPNRLTENMADQGSNRGMRV